MNESTSALVAQDWRQLERLARRYIQDCKGVFDSENLSLAIENIVIANMELNNIKIALEESQKCIDSYYDNLGCHVLKIEALIKLNRIPEARDEFNVAKRLLGHQLEMNEQNQQRASSQIEKEIYSTNLGKLRALESKLSRLHPKLD